MFKPAAQVAVDILKHILECPDDILRVSRLFLNCICSFQLYLFFPIVSLFLFYLLSSTHLGINDVFKSAAQVAADEHTASFCNNIHRGFFFHLSFFLVSFLLKYS